MKGHPGQGWGIRESGTHVEIEEHMRGCQGREGRRGTVEETGICAVWQEIISGGESRSEMTLQGLAGASLWGFLSHVKSFEFYTEYNKKSLKGYKQESNIKFMI